MFFKRTGDGGKRPVQEKAPIKEWAEAAFTQALVRDGGGSLKGAFRLMDTDNDGACGRQCGTCRAQQRQHQHQHRRTRG